MNQQVIAQESGRPSGQEEALVVSIHPGAAKPGVRDEAANINTRNIAVEPARVEG